MNERQETTPQHDETPQAIFSEQTSTVSHEGSQALTRREELEEMFKALKETVKKLDSNDPLRYQIMTCAPESWSINKISKEFEVSKRAARKSKILRAEKGIWRTIDKKLCMRIPETTTNAVRAFYLQDSNSKILPGMKDVMSIKVDGERRAAQKRLILYTIKELYDMFQTSHPEMNISLSYFCHLRPKNVVLPGASGTHVVCVCTIHQNIILMVDSISDLLNSIQSEDKPKTYQDFLKLIMCDDPDRDCYFSECEKCPDEANVSNYLINVLGEADISTVEYAKWISVDRTTMVNVTASVEDFADEFKVALSKLKSHSFITWKQSEYQKSLKDNLPTGTVLMMFDFTQNFTYVAQDAAQAFYFNNSQCSVFPLIFYYKEGGILKHRCCVFLSDCTKHDSAFVYAALTIILPKIRALIKSVKKVIYFTDGAKQHFKNRYQIDLLRHHKEDFGLEAEWHFSTTAHGRSEYDGIGGKFKHEAYKHSLQASPKDAILNFPQLVKWGESHFSNIEIFNFDKNYHDRITKKLARRFSVAPAVPGISKNHSFVFKNDLLTMRKFSTDEVCENL